jgi:NAD+ kinase
MLFKKIGIIYHPKNKAAHDLANELEKSLSSQGISCWVCSAWKSGELQHRIADSDLILTTGGDGTILRTAQVSARSSIPITGINLGKVGFMTELSSEEVMDKLPDLLVGKGWIDDRSMLDADFVPHGSGIEATRKFTALNDVVVSRGGIARVINIEVSIDKKLMTTYKADGVIIATATGSTGYSLAAGGPILNPEASELLLTPILPHLSPSYSLVLPPETEISLLVSTTHQATLCIDGHINLHLADGDIIRVRQSRQKTRFLRIHPRDSYYCRLEHKLKGNNHLV